MIDHHLSAAVSGAPLAAARKPEGPLRRLASLVRQRGIRHALAHCWAIGLLRVHERVFDRAADVPEVADTAGHVPLEELSIAAPARPTDEDIHYLPTPRLVLDWVFRLLPDHLQRYVFVDYGSGRGRVLLSAAERPFSKVIGVEFARELFEAAQANIAAFPPSRIKARHGIANHWADAATFPVPVGDAVLFFFNPFEADLMAHLARRIVKARKAGGGELLVVYVNPRYRQVFDDNAGFQAVRLPLAARLRFALLSPFDVAIYRAV